MNWFLAKIVYQIICGDGDHTAQFDEQLRLIEAEDESSAFIKAQRIGAQEQEVFYNQRKALVQWKFINVSELHKLSSLIDGAELYSSVQETEQAAVYLEQVQKKADHIQWSITHPYSNRVME